MRKGLSRVRCRAGLLLVAGVLLAEGCQSDRKPGGDDARPRPARNVIVLLGDGMSLPQIAFLSQYRRHVHPDRPETSFERLLRSPNHGFADTHMITPDGRTTLTVDSAASATQIACGVMTIPQVLGLDQRGYPCRTILEHARSLGMATGLVTDATVTHATPAAFAAKQVTRRAENEIAAEYVSTGKVDVLLGGGARFFLPAALQVNQVPECAAMAAPLVTSGARADARNILDEARAAGYELVCDEEQLLAVPETAGGKVLGTFAGAVYPAYPERTRMPGLPSLETVARKAIRILEQKPEGFFVMIEAGMIDFAAHEHDGAYLLRAMQEADRILGFLLAYVDDHPDTLLVVVADHETATPAFSYRTAPPVTTTLPSGLVHTSPYDFGDAVATYSLLERQTLSLGGMINPIARMLYLPGYEPNPAYPLERGIADLIAIVETSSGYTLTPAQARRALTIPPGSTLIPYDGVADSFYQDSPMPDRLSRVLVEQTQLLWATGHHSNLPVLVMAAGPAALEQQVRGYYHTTDVGRLLFEALGN